MKKKLLLSLILSASTIGLSAQTWSGTTPGNINYSLGNVGINSTDPICRLDIRGGDPSTTTDVLHIGGGSSWGGNGAAITLGGGALKSARIVGYTYDGYQPRNLVL